MVGGVQIMGQIIWAVRNLGDLRWGRLRSPGPEFLVPDRISDFGFIPLTPVEILAANCENCLVAASDVFAHNAAVRSGARKYYFAQDLTQT